MAAATPPWILISLFLVSFFSVVRLSVSQSNSNRNIETFYPFPPPPSPTIPVPESPANSPISPPSTPIEPPPLPLSPPLPPPPLPPPSSKSSSSNAVAKAVAATAASTIVVAALFFLLVRKYTVARRRSQNNGNDPQRGGGGGGGGGGRGGGGGGGERLVHRAQFSRFKGNLKGLIVDENGLDVLYWNELEGGNKNNVFRKEPLQNLKDDEKRMSRHGERRVKPLPVQETPLLVGENRNSTTSYDEVQDEVENLNRFSAPPPLSESFEISLEAVGKPESSIQTSTSSPPPPPPPPMLAIPQKQNPAPPPPPPIPSKINPTPPPPPPSSASKRIANGINQGISSSGHSRTGTGNGQVVLKPLHWDKVNTDANHSMVWHKIDGGSFSFDGDLMEALFGRVAANRRSPQRNHNLNGGRPDQSVQIFILDSRKSQNTAIVLRSLVLSRKEILNALIDGEDLNSETLEKLTRIAPTKEEKSLILSFNGDPTRLADAESFLFHVLKAVPSAFDRLNAMFFRSNYDSEILHLRECLQTLESSCKELRTRGLFLKLLEAILKAGNRMNAGTSRGNAQAFNLAALQKLSDVKSSDGKTTLLHFVVEEVVRSEGKRCVLNRNRSMSRSSSQSSSNSSMHSETSSSKDDREKEYIMIGLPVVGGLSAEFSNVKKAALIDHAVFASTCSTLEVRSTEIKQFVAQFGDSDEGFLRKMRSFLEASDEELRVVREAQTKVMELVKKTTEYYQPRSSKNKEASPLQLFVIVKDFLGMVDQVCVDIARNLQRRKTAAASLGSSSPRSKTPVKFPNLPPNFLSDKSRGSSSSDSEDEF